MPCYLPRTIWSSKKYGVPCYSGRDFRLKWTFKKREEDSKHVDWNAATTLCKDMTRFAVVPLQKLHVIAAFWSMSMPALTCNYIVLVIFLITSTGANTLSTCTRGGHRLLQ